ncbi:MAG: HD domain-containing protein [Elusimicrobia bacterium]|nr:HD domain-containing protein [Elusimicrobiota bacterium]MBU2614455.1 HD domain-containing protein [Elusimicrobiota bacterium]
MNKIIQTIIKEQKSNQKVWIVGGFLRDAILHKQTTDIDFVVDRNVLELAKRSAKRLSSRVITLDDVNRIYRIVIKSGPEGQMITLDFSAMSGKNINEDLSRRDFTINAVAAPLNSLDNMIDPYNGIADLKAKIIRSIAEKNFIDDPLRLLRAFRFSAELNFDILPQTLRQIKKHSKLISKPAKERVREELLKIFFVNNSTKYIYELDKNKLLEPLFPEIAAMKKSSRKFYFHPEGLWQHSKLSLASFEKLVNSTALESGFDPDLTAKIFSHISSRLPLLKFIALFHDVAKPQTVARINGRIRFFNHESEGAKKIKKIMQKLRFSNKEIQIAEQLVKTHMRPGNVAQSFHKGTLSPKAAYRFFRNMGDETIDLLLLSLADRMSYIGISAKPKEIELHTIFINKFSRRFFEYKQKISQPKLVDGYMIMKKFRIPSSPLIGKIIRFVEESQMTGKTDTTEQAIKLIKKNWRKLNEQT